ncbi:CRISPR-associated endonuclease/helicase Cas3 [Pseudochelatococcus lubricantis]|uniref:CRISPR-associated endonuclease/helicase Cas3 n=1 Tax=Pseudochelatococcus lubricantis TaxID=1538102 RepID=A0ABX0UX32_9HYPH|nr:CRISPR-associated helicase Cas3' [Pseudochelatococcus lubricantis]NIJ57498.1 CRISPR-associated endonuclease/helicase Cas3 [Pseudochelatococcus lubricantis]
MIYYAHTGKRADKSDWQILREHSLAVAKLAEAMAARLGLANAARLAGLLHDLGKYTAAFQRRLDGAPEGVDHSTAGAQAVLSLTSGPDRSIAELIAYAIAGHHAGLPDRRGEVRGTLNDRLDKVTVPPDPAWETELLPNAEKLVPEFFSRIRNPHAAFQISVIGRMIFSCLVDADYRDTEAFYMALEGRQADREWCALRALLPGFHDAFGAYMDGKKSDTPLNRLRGDILAHVRARAVERPGLFTLTVPTGGGKTLASLAFALDHARAHGHARIIYAIPFTSIIDQTAAIFREILGREHVLEHHSAIDEEKHGREGPPQQRDKLKLAMEDWAAPVVVTTNVQLFESLFAARPSRARKLHNIANSVIILDEAQTIPRHLLTPCMRMLDELALNYGCTIVLCTATQPALDERDLPHGLPLAGRELAPDPKGLADKLCRARIRHVGDMDNDALIRALRNEPQALVIVNSRRHAFELYKEAESAGIEGLVHLTTRQCATHRRRILEEVRERLRRELPVRVIATSLIEAGVDIDFPKVWRAEAGLDQIVQAAGRCNREGKRPVDDSIVSVFRAPDYSPPVEIAGLIGDMQRIMDDHPDLLSVNAMQAYFAEVYWRLGEGRLDEKKICERFRIVRGGTDFAYRSAAADFRMIESGMEPVIVALDDAAREAVARLGVPDISSGTIARQLQSYVVQVPPKARALLIANKQAYFAHPELRGDQFAVLGNMKLYREDVGLIWEDADYLAIEDLVV